MHLKENTLLQGGKYRIIRKLGQGGFGITYLAEQSGLGREVAIKEFFMSEYCDRDSATSRAFIGTEGSRMTVNRFLEKFLKEARNIANLKHPNIIAIYDIFEENNTAYYVMEYHPEGSLWSLVDKQGAMNEKQALHYIQQVALALKYIHNHRIMHLDIKPENILIDENNNAILIDFGISKVYDKHATVPMHKTPRSSIVTFSPEYAPIEQYTTDGVAEFSPATDIYSLGATLFTLLTGNCPPTAVKLVESDYLAEKLNLHKVSQQNIEAVVRSMAFTKEKRPQSIDEFLLLINSNGGGYKEPKKPFNWKPLIGIIAAILCVVFAGVGINKCNDYRAKQKRLAAIEKARQDSIAAVKRYNDSIAMVKRHNDSINKALAIKVAEQQRLAAIEKAKARQDSIKEQQRRDSIANLPGILYVTTNPAGATVTVAGKRIGNTPIEKYELKKGSYTVKITKDGYNTISKNITISNDPTVINIALTKTVKKETNKQNNKLTRQEIEKYYNDGVKAYNAGNYSEAVRLYSKAAEQGYVQAQCNLGYCYEFGRGVTKDLNEAVKWYSKAAAQGYAQAQYNLGYCYEFGRGVTKDLNEAVKWYRKAAEQGDADAQCNLGLCYHSGQGVTKDYTKAVKWFRKAAEQGHADAQFNLGLCYEFGVGVTKDLTEAAKWFRKAAEQGDAQAQFNLGVFYQYGTGVTKDYTEAVKWYRKAAEQGFAQAQNNLGLCYEYGTGVTKDINEAVKWYRKAAEQGLAEAQFHLGFCYQYGNGVTKDINEAVKWYRKAAEQGLAEAQGYLGFCYQHGIGVTIDLNEAVKWYRKAAEQGFADAQFHLGLCYEYGTGVTKDYTEAVKWYRKAAEQGYAQAQFHLGFCYEFGTGVTKDLNEAVKWYRKAAEQGQEGAKAALERLGK